MATLDIDPLLRKGFQLLHSRNRDSVDQLKALLDEAHRQRLGKSKDPFNLRRESPIPRSKQASPSNITLSKSTGSDLKRDISHTKSRDDELPHVLPKRPRLDSPHNVFKSHTPSPTPSIKSESSSKSRKSDESDSDADMNDLAMEIGINCTVCKSFEQTSGNQLVECQDCHSLYHQECHKPAVSHQDVTDPRLVWYCAKCSRSLKKRNTLMTSSSACIVGMRSSSSSSSPNTKNSTARPSPSKAVQRQSPFANLSSVSGRPIGSSTTSSSTSSTTTSRSSSTTRNATAAPAANSIMNAERRVHLMKKKAAKNAERRKIM